MVFMELVITSSTLAREDVAAAMTQERDVVVRTGKIENATGEGEELVIPVIAAIAAANATHATHAVGRPIKASGSTKPPVVDVAAFVGGEDLPDCTEKQGYAKQPLFYGRLASRAGISARQASCSEFARVSKENCAKYVGEYDEEITTIDPYTHDAVRYSQMRTYICRAKKIRWSGGNCTASVRCNDGAKHRLLKV